MAGLIRNSRLHVFQDGHLFLVSNAIGLAPLFVISSPEVTLT